MNLRSTLFGVAKPAWIVVVMGTGITLYSGQAEPYVSPETLPGGPKAAFAGMIVVAVVGWIAVSALQSNAESEAWKATGRRAGFTPAGGGGLWGQPDLEGSFGGRDVRAHVRERKRGSYDEGGGPTMFTFTLVETDLDAPTEEGVVAGVDGGRIVAGSDRLDVENMSANVYADEDIAAAEGRDLVGVEEGDIVVVGTSEAAARAVATDRAGEALRGLEKLNLVYVGDAGGVITTYIEHVNSQLDGFGSSLAERSVETFVERVPDDDATVTVETVAPVTDGEELRRHAEAVVAVADAFEKAAARTPASG